MREETRKHQTIDTFALLPPGTGDRLRLRGNNFNSPGLPTVLMDSHAEKKRKHSGSACCRRYLKPVLLISGMILLVDIIHDFFLAGAGNLAPPIIQRDYSQVHGIEDLSTESVQSKCFVCTS